MTKDEWNRVTVAAGALMDIQFYIQEYKEEIPEGDYGLIVVDSYKPDMGDLKKLAMERDAVVIATCPADTWLLQRSDKRPGLSDFYRHDHHLANDSDIIMGLYRDELYNREENNPNRGIMEIRLLKNRTGPMKDFLLYFDAEYLRSEDMNDLR